MRYPILQFQTARTLEKKEFLVSLKNIKRSLWDLWLLGKCKAYHLTTKGCFTNIKAMVHYTSRPWFTTHQGHGSPYIKAKVHYTSRSWFTYIKAMVHTHPGHGSLHIKVHYTSRPWFTTHQGHGSPHIKAMVHYTRFTHIKVHHIKAMVHCTSKPWFTTHQGHGSHTSRPRFTHIKAVVHTHPGHGSPHIKAMVHYNLKVH